MMVADPEGIKDESPRAATRERNDAIAFIFPGRIFALSEEQKVASGPMVCRMRTASAIEQFPTFNKAPHHPGVTSFKRLNPNVMARIKATSVDEYILSAPAPVQDKLMEIRALLKSVAPKAVEAIKWGIPVLEEGRILFAYSAHKTHMNFMPTGPALKPFTKELAHYKTGKDTVQFPYDKPLPKALIRKIAQYRVKDLRENDAKWMY